MILADMLPFDPAEHARRIREIKPVIIDTIESIRDSVDAIADTTAQSQVIIDNVSQGGEASFMLPIAVVIVALAGCLYLAHLYRKRHLAV